MAGLRGPDSSKDAQLLDERAVFPETVDVNIRQLDPIPAPRYFLKELPLTNEMSDLVLKSRQEIRDVLHGRDDRLLAIVGPCSIHDPKAAHEYAERLAAVKKELDDRLVIVMRVYFEKPRLILTASSIFARACSWLARCLPTCWGSACPPLRNGLIRLPRSIFAI